ncbi:MAG: enamine deaminase RidA [Pelagibacterales bacterium]|nr:enamine deaminase RidA [Pelagibacterales bacterium]|tara:strand:+ start:1660 stop:2058 length:399 start_codon:yes stop_codon:yes gene_type:complete
MANKLIQPKDWKAAKGYSNGILNTNGYLFIGGQIGWNSQQIFETHTFVGQMEQTLINIVTILEEAGGKINDLVRFTWYIKDKQEYLNNQKEIGRAYQKIMGQYFPAMAMVVVKDLIEEEAILEIEATAVIND